MVENAIVFTETDGLDGNYYLLEKGINPYHKLTPDEARELLGYLGASRLTLDDFCEKFRFAA